MIVGALMLPEVMLGNTDASMTRARLRLGLGDHSRVLCIVSEGATDPELFRAVVGQA